MVGRRASKYKVSTTTQASLTRCQIWVTAVRQKQRAAMHMWPGSSSEIGGYRPTYWDPFDSKVQPKEKAERVLQWLDLPFDDRPQLIGVYVPDVDMAGHTYGPESYEIARSLMRIDDMMRHLYAGLEARNLLDIVNVIVASIHIAHLYVLLLNTRYIR
jgi:predicted AlkP superfamily pyrophosphatase or phosphodiesterase